MFGEVKNRSAEVPLPFSLSFPISAQRVPLRTGSTVSESPVVTTTLTSL